MGYLQKIRSTDVTRHKSAGTVASLGVLWLGVVWATGAMSQPPVTLPAADTSADLSAAFLGHLGQTPVSGGLPKPVAPIPMTASGELIGFSHVDGTGIQTTTLINTRKSWMAVYHISNGVIRLVSSRPIDADFSLQLNATSPLPEEIRSMGGSAR